MRLLILAAVLGLSACTASDVEYQQQKDMNMRAIQETGMPAITRFSERHQLKTVYELRDEAITTTTYIVDLGGHLHKLCDSVGYGIPYSTQYSSPSNREPNSLYPPASADGTWVLCVDPRTKKTWPLYVEPHVIVSPFALTVR